MKLGSLVAAALVAVSGSLFAAEASAANFTLWVHGRNPARNTQAGNYGDFTYWGSAGTVAGVNKKAVNWDGYNSIASQNYRVRNALDCFCTGNNWCYIASHSAGDMQVGYSLALYGGTSRYRKNPGAVASDGTCSNSDGTTQVGWNIRWINAGASAAGGSELSDMGSWAMSEPLVADLQTTTARAKYNHNDTRSVWKYMFAGASGTLYSGLLPGQDDEAVAYHSSGGVSGSSGGGYCNPGEWFCDDLTSGTAPADNGRAKWSFHNTYLIDTGESYNHYANGNWAGIIAPTRSDVVSYAY